MAPDGDFKNFKDLLRSRGGTPKEDPDAGKGWTLESADAVTDDRIRIAPPPSLGEGARARIARRPPAQGPMDQGPAVYADLESEELQLLHSFRVRTEFPADVLAEVGGLPDDPTEADYAGRVDLREETIFTIDGADAKDYDDAIGIRELENGNVEVGVHIADVGHYVRPDTALDDEALARGTSVYVADQVVPMLPEKLSNGLCSLVPHRDRLAFSVMMEFTPKGQRVSSRTHKSVIRSCERNTYRVVQDLLDGKDSEEVAAIRVLEKPLKLFQDWTRTQQKLRDQKGSLRIQSREKKFVFDENHEVAAIVDYPRYFSNTLIEETALAANQAVGDIFRERGLPTIYRVHPEKDPEEIESVVNMLEEHGIRIPKKERLTGRDIGRLIRAARNRPNAEALIGRIMGLVERAFYEVRDHEKVAKHFGLAREAYLHFTSPIRRYPDLIVHRWLWSLESRGDKAANELRAGELIGDLNDVAQHCSLQAEVAEMTETAVFDLKVCQFMEPHIGETHEAKVLRVSRYGLEILFSQFNVTGFLPARSIGARPELKGPTLTLRAGKRQFSFTEGYAIKVKVKDVDFLKLQVLLELA